MIARNYAVFLKDRQRVSCGVTQDAISGTGVSLRRPAAGAEKLFRHTRTLRGLHVLNNGRDRAGCSKWHPSKAAGSSATEAYPWGTLQGDGRLRTTLGVIFSILL